MGFVQSAHNTGSGSSLAITLGSAPTSGNCLFGMAGVEASSGDTVTSFKTGTSTDNWASSVARNVTGTDGCGGAIWANPGLTVTTTVINVAFGASGGNGGYVIEWNGVSASPLDKTDSAAISSSTSFNSGTTATLTQASEVAIGFVYTSIESPTTTFTPPGAYTNLTALAPSSGIGGVGGYQQVSATTGLNYAGSSSATMFAGVALIATYKLGGSITVDLPLLSINTASGTLNPPIYVDLPLTQINTAAFSLTPGIGLIIDLPLLSINTAAYPLAPDIVPSVVVDLPLLQINTAAYDITPDIVPKIFVSLPLLSINTSEHNITPDITPVPPKLLVAIAAHSGVDPYAGYSYEAGISQFNSNSEWINILSGVISFITSSSSANAGLIQTLNTPGFLDILSGIVSAGDVQSEIFLESRDSGGGTAQVAVNTDAFNVNANESVGISLPTGLGNVAIGADGITVGNGSSAQVDLDPKMATPTNYSLITGGSATAAQICVFLSSWYSEFQNRGMAT